MKKRDEFLDAVLAEIRFFFDCHKIRKELSDHLSDSVDALMQEGWSESEAETQAVLQMGNAQEIGKALNRIHSPILGWFWLISTTLVLCSSVFFFQIGKEALLFIQLRYFEIPIDEPKSLVVSLNETFEFADNTLTLVDVIELESKEIALSFRFQDKPFHNRMRVGFTPFAVLNSQGEEITYGGIINFVPYLTAGYVQIPFPDDGIIYLRLFDNQIFVINLFERGLHP